LWTLLLMTLWESLLSLGAGALRLLAKDSCRRCHVVNTLPLP
jgi:hypothetical protein